MSEQSNKINWNLLEGNENKELHNYYQTLIKFRTTHPAFRSADLEFFHEDPEKGVIAFQRYDEKGDGFVVVLNLSDNDLSEYEITNFPFEGACFEITKEVAGTVNDHVLTVELQRREGLLLTFGR
jgi:1,4-alpha-glucan branching enzyme